MDLFWRILYQSSALGVVLSSTKKGSNTLTTYRPKEITTGRTLRFVGGSRS